MYNGDMSYIERMYQIKMAVASAMTDEGAPPPTEDALFINLHRAAQFTFVKR